MAGFLSLFCWLGSAGHYIDKCAFPRALPAELHPAVCLCEQGMIMTKADIVPGVKFGASLPDDDVTGSNGLTAKTFYTQPFGM